MKWLIFFCCLAGIVANAAEVIKMGKNNLLAISENKEKPWKVKDAVCITRDSQEVGCGVVMRTVKSGAVVKLDFGFEDIRPGDKAVLSKEGRKPGSVSTLKASQRKYIVNLAVGGNASTTFFYPVLDFQVALGRHFSLGLMPFFYSAKNSDDPLAPISVSAFGGFLTLNFYSSYFFQGFWVQVAPGMHLMTGTQADTTEKVNAIGFKTHIGYRFHIGQVVNIGLGVGGAYKKDPNFTFATDNSAGFQPLACIDLGVSF